LIFKLIRFSIIDSLCSILVFSAAEFAVPGTPYAELTEMMW